MTTNLSFLKQDLVYRVHQAAVKLDPRIEMARCYHKIFREWPDFSNPKTLNEKIYWLQLNTDTSLWSICADKYRVREYVASKGLGNYLNSLYAVWDSPDEIDFNQLPDKFVLKTTNGCSQYRLCDKNIGIDRVEILNAFKWWHNHPFGVSGGELHYLKIQPRIIAEKYLEGSAGKDSLIDYKIWCFSGKPFCFFVPFGRSGTTFEYALYDLDWVPMHRYAQSTAHAKYNPSANLTKPASFEEMINIAEVLSNGFPQVRIDLYEVDSKPVFGEMTFSTGFGYFTKDFYRILGDKVVLPKGGSRH